jgi:aconitate hydratase
VFLRGEGREEDFIEVVADSDADYDLTEDIDLSTLEPLIARPSSPGNVVPVREVAGTEVSQVVLGSSANPGLRDYAIVAAMVAGRQTHDAVSFDVNPSSREILADLTRMGATFDLIAAGARIHQAGCLGCIGMGQAPAAGRHSLRTFPRNFPGRSGTKNDAVWLCSPETAAASALTGVITDPRALAAQLGLDYPTLALPERASVNTAMLEAPLPPEQALAQELVKGPNIASLPAFPQLAERIEAPVLLKVGDDVSTDEISPAGAQALPLRSNIPKLAEFTFTPIDPDYPRRAAELTHGSGHVVIGGHNYGQGSSREHAAITARYLSLHAVIAKSFARIHWQNLANFGILALEFTTEGVDRAPPGPADQPAEQRGHGQAGHRPPQECVVDSADVGIGEQVKGEAGPVVWLRTNSQRRCACHKPLATATGVVPNSHGECGSPSLSAKAWWRRRSATQSITGR